MSWKLKLLIYRVYNNKKKKLNHDISVCLGSSTGNREQKITGEDIREQRTEVIQGQWKHRGVRSER